MSCSRFELSIPDRNRHVPDRYVPFPISRNIAFVFPSAYPVPVPGKKKKQEHEWFGCFPDHSRPFSSLGVWASFELERIWALRSSWRCSMVSGCRVTTELSPSVALSTISQLGNFFLFGIAVEYTRSKYHISDGCTPTLVTAKMRVTKFTSLMWITSVTCEHPSLITHKGDCRRIRASLKTHKGDNCRVHTSPITHKGDGYRYTHH